MKSDNFPLQGESSADSIGVSVGEPIGCMPSERQFIERGLASRNEAFLTNRFVSSEHVIDRLEDMLQAAKVRD